MKKLYRRFLRCGICACLAAGMFGSAYAANTYDMTSDAYKDGIDVNDTNFPKYVGDDYNHPDTFLYRYDSATETVQGGTLNITSETKKQQVFAKFQVKASDLPDLSNETVTKVLQGLAMKQHYEEGVTYNYTQGYAKLQIVDDEGNVLRNAQINFTTTSYPDYYVTGQTAVLNGGLFTQVLANDGTADQYDITQTETESAAANTIYLGHQESTVLWNIKPDLREESVKAAVRGAEKDLYVTNTHKSGSPITNIHLSVIAEGSDSDTVYGVYNDQKGLVSLKATTLDITATGNDKSSVIYAGNNADYVSKVIWASTDYPSGASTATSTGNAIEAGKNGEVDIDISRTKISSEKGHILYAHDGGKITVGRASAKYAGVASDSIGEGKYLALAENGGKIDFGIGKEHIDDIDYDNVTIYGTSTNLTGNIKADETSEINIGLKKYSGTGGGSSLYTGDVIGNVNLYLTDGYNWTGNALDENVTLSLGNDSSWTITNASHQHLKKYTGAESSSKRSYVVVGEGGLTLDKYSGNTTFVYAHDTEDPTNITSGQVTIVSADPVKLVSSGVGDVQYQVSESDSTVYLQTSIDGIDTTNEDQVNDVLDSLAKKLTYTAYTTGERNLSGRVEIAEGLTSASLSKYYKKITFDEETGTAETEGRLYRPYNQVLFGNETKDADCYGSVMSGTVADGDLKYTFNEDALIEVKQNEDPRTGMKFGAVYLAAVNNYGDKQYQSTAYATKGGPSYTIDMQGHNLTVHMSAYPTAGATGSQPMWTVAGIGAYRDGTITIDNPGAVSITSENNYYYGSAIRASTAAAAVTGAHVVINNDNTKEHAVKIRGGIATPSYQLNWRAIEVTTTGQGKYTAENGNSVVIKGLVDINVDNCASLFARGNYATIDIGGGSIVSNNYSAIWTSGNEAAININMLKDEDGNVIGTGTNYVQISGDTSTATPFYGSNGTINLGLVTEDSYLKGHFYGKGTNNLYLQNGAYWDNDETELHSWSTGAVSLNSVASVVTNLYGGDSAENAGNILQGEAETITIGNLYGHTNVYMAHDETDPTNFDAVGNVIIQKAHQTDGKNAGITMFTDRSGIDTSNEDAVANVLSALAKKIIYEEAIATEENPNPTVNLDGHVGISEGLTAGSVAVRLADIDFSSSDGTGILNADSIHTPDSYIPILYGSSETAMMKGAKSAMAASALLWRAENNDLMKRMGDLRLSPGDTGVWAKYYSGRYQMDAQNTDLSLKYKAYQVGFDKKAGNWIVGAAFSYNDGDASYGTGSADLEAKSFGLYGTWKGKSGQYLDVIAKYSRLDDEYDVHNTSGHKLDGDYKTSGVSLSVEYGRRLERENGFYTEPSVELTFGHIGSKDYSAQSDYLTSVGTKKDMEVHQGGFTTLVGRLGVRVGQKRAHSSYFGKVALAHEFDGGFDSTFRAAGEPEGKTSLDFGGTWLELAVGGTLQLKDSTSLYGSVERSFGSDVEEKWRIDAGLRFSF